MIEINEERFKFKVSGQVLEISQASVKQEIEHQKKIQDIQERNAGIEELFEANIKYLIELGAKEDVIRSMSRNGFMQILEHVSGVVKKN